LQTAYCAEWIVEALVTEPVKIPELPRYDTVDFTNSNAGTYGGAVIPGGFPEPPNNVIFMKNATNTGFLSEGEILSDTEIQVSYTGT
jgi:hypothetical protein